MASRKKFQYQVKAEPIVFAAASTVVAISIVASEVIFPRSFIYQSKAEPVPVETITVDKWFAPISEPVRTRQIPVSLQPSVAAPVAPIEVVTVDKWFAAWRDPAKPKELLRVQYQQATAFDASFLPNPSNLPEGWIQRFSDPIRTKAGLPANQQQFLAFTAPISETITEDKWHQRWSEPVRTNTKALAITQIATGSVSPPPIFDNAASIFSYSSQVTFKSRFIYQSRAFPTPFTIPSEDTWHHPWSQPPKPKPRLLTANQQAFFWSTFTPAVTPPSAMTVTASFSSEVVFPRSFIYQSKAAPVFTPAAAVPDFIQFVQGDTGLTFQKTIIYQISAEALSPETHVFWYEPWSEPVRVKAGLGVANQQAFFWSTVTPTAPVTTQVNPATITSEVVFQRSFIYQSLAYAPFTPPTETITEDKWHQAWSEPVRVKSGLAARLQQTIPFVPFIEVVTEDKWHQPWSIPSVMSKARLLEGRQQFLAYSFSKPIVSFGYYGWLTEPVRLKKGLGSQYQQFFTTDPSVIPTSRTPTWLYPWSEPVRQKIGLRPSLQQSIAHSPFVSEVITEDKWHQAWSEPVRIKLGLRPSLQQAATPATPIQPNLPTTIPWFSPLNEPVKLKQGLAARYQQFFNFDTKPPVVTISVTLSATEVNTDSALFGISPYNKADTAWVSVQEVKSIRNAAVSISEVDPPRVSLTENAAVSLDEVSALSSAAVSVSKPPGVLVISSYISEDGTKYYVTEDGTSYYIREV